jgi:hypothetical protein
MQRCAEPQDNRGRGCAGKSRATGLADERGERARRAVLHSRAIGREIESAFQNSTAYLARKSYGRRPNGPMRQSNEKEEGVRC